MSESIIESLIIFTQIRIRITNVSKSDGDAIYRKKYQLKEQFREESVEVAVWNKRKKDEVKKMPLDKMKQMVEEKEWEIIVWTIK
jgi:uncharacterized circularly permuted ATP-grasp superfamily protein